jgi:hypothetical protein
MTFVNCYLQPGIALTFGSVILVNIGEGALLGRLLRRLNLAVRQVCEKRGYWNFLGRDEKWDTKWSHRERIRNRAHTGCCGRGKSVKGTHWRPTVSCYVTLTSACQSSLPSACLPPGPGAHVWLHPGCLLQGMTLHAWVVIKHGCHNTQHTPGDALPSFP